MGLSRLPAAGPPDPEQGYEDAVRLSKLNRRLTEFSIEPKQKQLKDKRVKRTFRLWGKTLVGCTFHSRDAKCLSFWTWTQLLASDESGFCPPAVWKE